ncbi:MAG: hypothetical protein ACOCG5_08610 [Candidatus Alkaliphilus sp. MAG34]
MTKQEFESRIGGEVTPEEYDKIQTVYVHNDYYAVCPKCGNTRQLKEA